MNLEITEFAAVPDLMKRFVEAPYSATVTTVSLSYQLKTNYRPLFSYVCNLIEEEKDHIALCVPWECTVLRDSDYPLDHSDDLHYESEGLDLHLQPGRLIAVDHDHHRIVAFFSEDAPVTPSSLMQELISLSQISAIEGNSR